MRLSRYASHTCAVAALSLSVQWRCCDGSPSKERTIILASHGRLSEFDVDTFETRVIHEGRGVYHGVVPADIANNVWVVSRPHNDRDYQEPDKLLRINIATGEILQEHIIASKFTHEAVRHQDRIFVTNTKDGEVLELQTPSMELLKTHRAFSPREHINTLHVVEDGKSLWVMCHNKGEPSKIVNLDLATGKRLETIDAVGMGAHGVVGWKDCFILLDSNNGRLVAYNRTTREKEVLWQSGSQAECEDYYYGDYYGKCAEANGHKEFLKGILVVEDVVYFGISPSLVHDRGGRKANFSVEVGAFHLGERALRWRKSAPTQGLLNVIAAPHLAESSTYRAVTSWGPEAGRRAEL